MMKKKNLILLLLSKTNQTKPNLLKKKQNIINFFSLLSFFFFSFSCDPSHPPYVFSTKTKQNPDKFTRNSENKQTTKQPSKWIDNYLVKDA